MGEVVPISDATRTAREELLRAHLEAHNAGDIDAVLATFSRPRIEIIPSGRVLDGADAVRDYLAERRRSFADLHYEPIMLHHADRAVIVEYWVSATHRGDHQGVPATGKRFKARMVAIFEFDDGKIASQRLYYDAGTIVRQLA